MTGYEVVSHRTVHTGRVITVRTDAVRAPTGEIVERDVVEHPGAVIVVALDGTDRVLLVAQYRHPVRGWLRELPAGLLDHHGESPVQAARRELFEEADLRARTWHTLLDLRVSPGGMNEPVRVYLARDVQAVPESERHRRGAHGEVEEADLRQEWIGLDDAVSDVMSGRITNAAAVAGLLAAFYARAHEWRPLRAVDAPWMPRHLDAPASSGAAEGATPSVSGDGAALGRDASGCARSGSGDVGTVESAPE